MKLSRILAIGLSVAISIRYQPECPKYDPADAYDAQVRAFDSLQDISSIYFPGQSEYEREFMRDSHFILSSDSIIPSALYFYKRRWMARAVVHKLGLEYVSTLSTESIIGTKTPEGDLDTTKEVVSPRGVYLVFFRNTRKQDPCQAFTDIILYERVGKKIKPMEWIEVLDHDYTRFRMLPLSRTMLTHEELEGVQEKFRSNYGTLRVIIKKMLPELEQKRDDALEVNDQGLEECLCSPHSGLI